MQAGGSTLVRHLASHNGAARYSNTQSAHVGDTSNPLLSCSGAIEHVASLLKRTLCDQPSPCEPAEHASQAQQRVRMAASWCLT